MTPEAFCNWLAEMKSAGLIKTDLDAARLLGVTANTVVALKRDGVPGSSAVRTALACRALLAGLPPYGSEDG